MHGSQAAAPSTLECDDDVHVDVDAVWQDGTRASRQDKQYGDATSAAHARQTAGMSDNMGRVKAVPRSPNQVGTINSMTDLKGYLQVLRRQVAGAPTQLIKEVITLKQYKPSEVEELCSELERLANRLDKQEAVYMEQIIACLKPHAMPRDESSSEEDEAEEAPVPEYYVCPISHDIMTDPVILIDSRYTFHRPAIEAWLKTNKSCPITGKAVTSTEPLKPNFALRNAIDKWCRKWRPAQDHAPLDNVGTLDNLTSSGNSAWEQARHLANSAEAAAAAMAAATTTARGTRWQRRAAGDAAPVHVSGLEDADDGDVSSEEGDAQQVRDDHDDDEEGAEQLAAQLVITSDDKAVWSSPSCSSNGAADRPTPGKLSRVWDPAGPPAALTTASAVGLLSASEGGVSDGVGGDRPVPGKLAHKWGQVRDIADADGGPLPGRLHLGSEVADDGTPGPVRGAGRLVNPWQPGVPHTQQPGSTQQQELQSKAELMGSEVMEGVISKGIVAPRLESIEGVVAEEVAEQRLLATDWPGRVDSGSSPEANGSSEMLVGETTGSDAEDMLPETGAPSSTSNHLTTTNWLDATAETPSVRIDVVDLMTLCMALAQQESQPPHIDLKGQIISGPMPHGQQHVLITQAGTTLVNGSLRLPPGAGLSVTAPDVHFSGLQISGKGPEDLGGLLVVSGGPPGAVPGDVLVDDCRLELGPQGEGVPEEGDGSCGVLVCTGAGGRLVNTEVVGASQDGVRVEGEGSHLVVRRCQATGNARCGFASVLGARLEGEGHCVASHNQLSGFLVQGPGSVMSVGEDCMAVRNGEAGFLVAYGGLMQTGPRCSATNNMSSGFGAQGQNSRLVLGEKCISEGNEEAGVLAIDGAAVELGRGCQTNRNQKAGLSSQGVRAIIRVGEECVAEANQDSGVLALDGGMVDAAKGCAAVNNVLSGFCSLGEGARVVVREKSKANGNGGTGYLALEGGRMHVAGGCNAVRNGMSGFSAQAPKSKISVGAECIAKANGDPGFLALDGGIVEAGKGCQSLGNGLSGFCASGSRAELFAAEGCVAEGNGEGGFLAVNRGALAMRGRGTARGNRKAGFSAQGDGARLMVGEGCIAESNADPGFLAVGRCTMQVGSHCVSTGNGKAGFSSQGDGTRAALGLGCRAEGNAGSGYLAVGGGVMSVGMSSLAISNTLVGFCASGEGSELTVGEGCTGEDNGETDSMAINGGALHAGANCTGIVAGNSARGSSIARSSMSSRASSSATPMSGWSRDSSGATTSSTFGRLGESLSRHKRIFRRGE